MVRRRTPARRPSEKIFNQGEDRRDDHFNVDRASRRMIWIPRGKTFRPVSTERERRNKRAKNDAGNASR